MVQEHTHQRISDQELVAAARLAEEIEADIKRLRRAIDDAIRRRGEERRGS